MSYEEKYMYRCLQLARYGNGYVAPNPMVGAVIVHQGKIIGEGFHQRYGEPHAEPNAISSVKDSSLLKHSTLYVNLEPCAHYGKTPPCANLIVSSGIPKVVIGTLDPNPKVAGKGVAILKNAGIEVIYGVLEDACNELNKRFMTLHKFKRPYVLLKWAQTRDGFIDINRQDVSVTPLIISNLITKQLTHKYRSENQSIMVSTNTVVLDNPSLTVRRWGGKSPLRLAIDRRGIIPANYELKNNQLKTYIFTENPMENTEKLEYIQLDFSAGIIRQILTFLASRNIHSVLVEGGAKLLNSLISEGCWDEANVEVSNQLIGSGVQAPALTIQCERLTQFENHLWINYINRNKQF